MILMDDHGEGIERSLTGLKSSEVVTPGFIPTLLFFIKKKKKMLTVFIKQNTAQCKLTVYFISLVPVILLLCTIKRNMYNCSLNN